MSRKNPYEMRLETLCLAREILAENANAQREIQDMLRNALLEGSDALLEGEAEGRELYDPHTFNTNDVLTEALKLYEFVCKDEGRDKPTPAPVSGQHSGLPGDYEPATHPAANSRVTVLNERDLHVSMDKHACTVHVWYAEHLYVGVLYFSKLNQGLVYGIFPAISEDSVLDRIESALAAHQKVPVRLRYSGNQEIPPPHLDDATG